MFARNESKQVLLRTNDADVKIHQSSTSKAKAPHLQGFRTLLQGNRWV